MSSFESVLDLDGPGESEDPVHRGRHKQPQAIPSDVVGCQNHRPAHEKCACWWRGCTTTVNCYSRVADERVKKLLSIAFNDGKPHLCSVHETAAINAVYMSKPNAVLARWLRRKMRHPVILGDLRFVS